MPFIKRDAQGNIIALTSQREGDHDEYLPTTDPEVVSFLGMEPDQDEALKALRESDSELARVAEDLIQVLIEKQVILFTDLPDAVQQKLVSRQKLRSLLNQENPSLLSDDDML
ncbi:tryptophan synthase subunit beta like protein [Litoribrevibacter albus]|uniref:Tryptophan synthase subunit beta like protein n=1 Tax=Litoribrevibacter albus TaxID=1473156 RepID=A0AA37W6Y7_9GAMM|nr:tryptophan synthase subunit beta like protein [Litoribrevibacter albus]GLQ30673.1 hypothetical protein GCM10007876_11520 [Litoribrevibacter albus]